jgi:hypothetical protein
MGMTGTGSLLRLLRRTGAIRMIGIRLRLRDSARGAGVGMAYVCGVDGISLPSMTEDYDANEKTACCFPAG